MSLALTAEHRHDLAKSGLTDETIFKAQIHALRPHDLDKMGERIKRHATSALVIPYFDRAGKQNGFERRKLFPAVPMDNGHSLRYWQPPKSGVHLYLPPLFDWQALAADATTPLCIAEGEKKALAGCQHGLNTIGLGGCWNWKLTLDTGEKIVLPMLECFAWQGRRVELVPDDDAWGPGREFDILAGFYLLGLELIQRGAVVTLVRLPHFADLPKTGLDDYLLRENSLWRDAWDRLERLALDNPRFHVLARWQQDKRAREAERDAAKSRNADEPIITTVGGGVQCDFPAYQARLFFDRFSTARGIVKAELSVNLTAGAEPTRLLTGTDINLKSLRDRGSVAASLARLASLPPWKTILEIGCAKALTSHRDGEPPERLSPQVSLEPLTYQLGPLVYQKKATVFYGDGGIGKSLLGLLAALAVETGHSIAGLCGKAGRALYLDYEDSWDVHQLRWQAIWTAHPELKADVLYQRGIAPLPEFAPTLARLIAQQHIDFLVIDSLAYACGGDPQSADTAMRFFRALRPLPCVALIFGHVAKNTPIDEKSIFGSVFHGNSARATWEVRKVQDVGGPVSRLGLFNAKYNLDGGHKALGIQLTFGQGHTEATAFDVTEEPDFRKKLSHPERLQQQLRAGRQSLPALAEATGIPVETCKTTLYRGQEAKRPWCRRVGEEWE